MAEFMTGAGKTNGRNMRTLKGAMGLLDNLMEQQNFEAEDIKFQFHKLLTKVE